MQKLVSIIVPCYNEEKALPIFYEELVKVIDRLPDYRFEMLFVNDGSRDGTLDVMRALAKKDPERVVYLSFSRNFGKESAMFAGFTNAHGDFAAVMDADMQDPPDLLPEMLNILKSGEYDSVATRRVNRAGEPPIRSFFARKFYKLINRFSDADIVDGARDFRLMKRSMVDAIVSMNEYNRFSKGIFGWIGFRTYWLPYENRERVAGETKWNFWKLFKYAIEGIINFSEAPLAIASLFGVLLSMIGFISVIFIVIRRLFFGDPVAGWASLTSIVVFLGGIELLCLGIIGKYMAKVYTESKHRPHYIVAESNREDVHKIR